MRESIWNKRIPTMLGLLMITIGIAITSFLVKTGVITVGRAAPTETPDNVRISNITATSFTVSYTTQAKTLGSLSYGTTSNYGSIAFDDRDQKTENAIARGTHYITLRNLQPSTLYFFAITSGKDTYLHNNNPFQVSTGSPIQDDPPKQPPATGKVLLPDGSVPEEAIVYFSSTGTQTIASITDASGNYILPLNSLRSEDLTRYAVLTKDQILMELIVTSTQKSNVKLLANQINPIPPITLSQDYDFTLSTTPVASSSAQLGFPSFNATIAGTEPKILTPKNDQGFSDQQPQFRGVASPGADIQIIIHSEQLIQTNITADKNGNWSFRPNEQLAPGAHTISIITRDPSGIMKTIKQSFTVYAAGTQVSQSATPSATPLLSPTPTQVVVPTAIPTVELLPSPTQSVILSPTPIVFVPISGPTKGGLPPVGNESTTVLGIAAIATTSLGVLLFLFSRSAAWRV